MEMVVCSGVAIRLCRDKAWLPKRVTTSNAPFSDLNKSFQAFLKTFEIASFLKRKTHVQKKHGQNYIFGLHDRTYCSSGIISTARNVSALSSPAVREFRTCNMTLETSSTPRMDLRSLNIRSSRAVEAASKLRPP